MKHTRKLFLIKNANSFKELQRWVSEKLQVQDPNQLNAILGGTAGLGIGTVTGLLRGDKSILPPLTGLALGGLGGYNLNALADAAGQQDIGLRKKPTYIKGITTGLFGGGFGALGGSVIGSRIRDRQPDVLAREKLKKDFEKKVIQELNYDSEKYQKRIAEHHAKLPEVKLKHRHKYAPQYAAGTLGTIVALLGYRNGHGRDEDVAE